MYLDRTRRPANFDEGFIQADIARLIEEIDSWTVLHLPRARGARRHTHSLGEIVSHVAKTYAETWQTVLHVDDEELRHKVWFYLGEVLEGYAELVDDIRARRVQLPSRWHRIRQAPPDVRSRMGDTDSRPVQC
ncbi:hypothetical protein ACW9HO_37565 [Nocardia gipuzkoensis]